MDSKWFAKDVFVCSSCRWVIKTIRYYLEIMALLSCLCPKPCNNLLLGHGIYSYSQSSCKLMFYTEYGTRSLIACIIVSITAYSWVGLQQGFDSVDSKIRNNMGWIILTAFAIQGLFGMAPAVYLDVDPWTSSHCIWAENVSTEHEVIIAT